LRLQHIAKTRLISKAMTEPASGMKEAIRLLGKDISSSYIVTLQSESRVFVFTPWEGSWPVATTPFMLKSFGAHSTLMA
jgi:hypothetical protein